MTPDGAPPTRSATPARDGVNPGYALGRDYPGLEHGLLVAVTERRTTEDIDRLAEALAQIPRPNPRVQISVSR